jgi:ABC-type multidrug transport system fused ATPase/permease subunit
MFLNEIKNTRPLIDELQAELKSIGPYLGKPTATGRVANMAFSSTLEFQGVSYRYPTGSFPALSKIDLMIRFGEVIGLVGTSGAGKSTFVDILLGLLEPTEGRILVDGHPPRRDSSGLRTAGYVPQSSPLINGTLCENIAFGIPPGEVDQVLLREAATAARIDDFIAALPDGFDTEVGEFGTRLSGGQRQRIGIARAFYGRPSLLILDEATSDLDTLTEFEITESINALRGQITIVLVAHRLHILKSCDRIVFLKNGQIMAIGAYDDLLATCPEFRELEKVLERYATARPEPG